MKNKNIIFEIVKKEIRDVVRDKKTLFMMIIIPILLYPLIFGFILTLQDSFLNTDKTNYNKIGFAFETDEILNKLIEKLEIDKIDGNEKELEEKLEKEEINAYITIKDKTFIISYSEKNQYGNLSLQMSKTLLEEYKKISQSQILITKGINPDEIINNYIIEDKDISKTDAMKEFMIELVPTFILITTTLTSIFAAIDMTAGEKERGTLETLLTFPIKKKTIIGGKFIATVLCTILSSILGFISMYSMLYYLSGKLESFNKIELLSIDKIILIMILFVEFSMLISALAIAISSKSKSFKEAQNKAQPLAFITMIPMFISMMGIKIDFKLSLIPFINVNLLMSEIIANTLNINYYIISLLSNTVFTLIILKLIDKLYKSDKILF